MNAELSKRDLMTMICFLLVGGLALSPTAFGFCGSAFSYKAVDGQIVFKSWKSDAGDRMIPDSDKPLPSADVQTFKTIPMADEDGQNCGSAYAKDRSQVYYKGEVISHEPDKFQLK